ncbi:hypothetical protein ETB97_004444 [Aspergillus alliaceus]|uniref:Uncharacterized protein n=1 Tax=Petromyces alliaceus TaxID=209559 RepID=A0A8H6A0E2_PETAA|nr:hypothetical protein ETB97_004444 [Aspergillus burnettii]
MIILITTENPYLGEPSGVEDRNTTSIILSTRTTTITACTSTVPNCPASAKNTSVTTETLVISIAACPITITQSLPTTGPSVTESSYPDQASGGRATTTSTIFSTRTATITACPSSIPNCPASTRSTLVTTETPVVSTTVHPVAAAPTVSNISGGSPTTVLVTAGDDVGSGSGYDSAPVYVSSPSASGVSGPSSSSSSANANTNAGTNLDSIIPSSTSGPTFSFGTSAGSNKNSSSSSLISTSLQILSSSAPTTTSFSTQKITSASTSSIVGSLLTGAAPAMYFEKWAPFLLSCRWCIIGIYRIDLVMGLFSMNAGDPGTLSTCAGVFTHVPQSCGVHVFLSSSVGVADLIAEGFASELILAYTEAKAIQNTRQDLDAPYRSMQQMMGYLDKDPVD